MNQTETRLNIQSLAINYFQFIRSQQVALKYDLCKIFAYSKTKHKRLKTTKTRLLKQIKKQMHSKKQNEK